LINLAQAPATMLVYAAGVAALGAERYDLVGRLLTEPRTTDLRTGKLALIADLLDPELTLSRRSRHLFEWLRPVIAGHLGLGGAYDDAWQRFEYLRWVSGTATRLAQQRGVSSGVPHMQVTDSSEREYVPVPAAWFRRLLGPEGTDDPFTRAGIAGGDRKALLDAANAYDDAFHRLADDTATSTLTQRMGMAGGFLPSGIWWVDEAGKWATTS
jgi:hypothetical protein